MCSFSTYDLEVHVEVRNVQENRNSCCYWRDLNTQGSELHLDDGRVYTTEATAASARVYTTECLSCPWTEAFADLCLVYTTEACAAL